MSLARRIGAVHLRIDTIEQAMRNAGFTVSGPEGYLTWQQVLHRHYEPWTTAYVIDTAGRTLEDTLSQAEEIVRWKDR